MTDDKSNNAQAKSKAQGKKSSNSMYQGVDGNPISKDILADITQFQVKNKRNCNILKYCISIVIAINDKCM